MIRSAAALPDLFAQPNVIDLPLGQFPSTRYQGSKRRLLSPLKDVFARFSPGRVVDLYSGTATVSLLLRLMGWSVVANDFLLYNNATARLLLGQQGSASFDASLRSELAYLLYEAPLESEPKVSKNFGGIFFPDEENLEIDRFCQSVGQVRPERRALYVYAVGQALLMKRPYNLFHRANLAMRSRNVERTFGNATTWAAPILQHAAKIASRVLDFPFSEARSDHSVTSQNTLDLASLPDDVDLVYLDPPYLNRNGIGVDYCHFYHFLDGLCDYSLFDRFDSGFSHRPITLRPSAWSSVGSAVDELERIIIKWPRATIVLSYRSDGLPDIAAIENAFAARGRSLHSTDSRSYKYALSHAENTRELFFISEP